MAGTLVSCNEDFKDWADPQSSDPEAAVEVAFAATETQAYDFNEMTEQTQVQIFVPLLVCNVEGATNYFTATLYNADKTKSANIEVDNSGMATIDNVTSAIIAVAGTQSVQQTLPLVVTAYTTVNGVTVRNSDELTLTATIVPVPVPEVWYITGNFVGNATGSFLAAGCVPMYPNPDNYEELVFGAKMDPSSYFVIYKQEGKRYPYIAASKEDGSLITVESKEQVENAESIKPGLAAGYYRITYNVKSNTLSYEAIDGHEAFTAMSMPGGYQGWDPSTNLMTAETTSPGLENHDWSVTVTFESDTKFKFCANLAWSGNDWGSTTFPIGLANVSDDIKATAGTYKVIFNDLTKNFYCEAVE